MIPILDHHRHPQELYLNGNMNGNASSNDEDEDNELFGFEPQAKSFVSSNGFYASSDNNPTESSPAHNTAHELLQLLGKFDFFFYFGTNVNPFLVCEMINFNFERMFLV